TFQQLDVIVGHDVIHLPGVEAPTEGPTEPGEEDKDVDVDAPDDHEANVTLESNTERPGDDFRDYEMGDGDAGKCAMDCAGEPKCKAYTFVKPADGKSARCHLKSKVPSNKVRSPCCVSGVKK